VDIVPTLIGLAGIDVQEVQEKLKKDHTEVHPLVGRDLTSLLNGNPKLTRGEEALYFMTDDEFSKGLNQYTLTGQPYEAVKQPNHLESVIVKLSTGDTNSKEIWKFTRYFDHSQFWSDPGVEDVETIQKKATDVSEDHEAAICITTTKTQPVPDQFELYNITKDPFEEINLAHPTHETPESKVIQKLLTGILQEQREQKRLTPSSGTISGKP
jgi:arylsulfatase A-like enzyme